MRTLPTLLMVLVATSALRAQELAFTLNAPSGIVGFADQELEYTATGIVSGTQAVAPDRISGWDMSVGIEGGSIVSASIDGTLAGELIAADGVDETAVTQGPGNNGMVSAVTLSGDSSVTLPASGNATVFEVVVRTRVPASGEGEVRLFFVDGRTRTAGEEGVVNRATSSSGDVFPLLGESITTVMSRQSSEIEVGPFLRGDCNGDGNTVGVADAITMLIASFLGGVEPPCLAACDFNSDGDISGVTDAIHLLTVNFLGGAVAPLAPYPDCGCSALASDVILGCERISELCGAASTCRGGLELELTIDAPAVADRAEITVGGTAASLASTVSVSLNGVPAVVVDQTWEATVTLGEGTNVLTVVASDERGNVAVVTDQVKLDTTPPRVIFKFPPDGYVTSETQVAVIGSILDAGAGAVDGSEYSVDVNGTPAVVSNGGFVTSVGPLAAGANRITAEGRDPAGNRGVAEITITLQEPTGPRIRAVSGGGQIAGVGESLGEPLVAELLDPDGAPIADRRVIFRVFDNNGAIALTAGGQARRAVASMTDAAGRARVFWTLGDRAGAGNNRVEARSVGVAGTACFAATAIAGEPAAIHVDSGNHQIGAPGRRLPHPLAVVVTDRGHNRLAGIPVTFTVLEGGGALTETSGEAASGSSDLTVITDAHGRAEAVLTTGRIGGIGAQTVAANFEGSDGPAILFVASARVPGSLEETSVSGVVLDNSDVPIEGVTVHIEDTDLTAVTDAQGRFSLAPAPVGHILLHVDGSTASRPGSWPTLEFELVTVPGLENTVGQPIFLLPLNDDGLQVDEDRGGTLTLPDMPGFSLTVAPGTATFPDGGPGGVVSVTVVHADKIPMTPNFGQQPRFVVTIQPPGAHFDPPAPISLPNVDGLAPGEITEMYSFDHDLGSFVAIGTGSVSEDGSVIRSDPGVGITKGGWHCGGNPQTTGNSASLSVRTEPRGPICKQIGRPFSITAFGRPPLDSAYSWEILPDAGTPADYLEMVPPVPDCCSTDGAVFQSCTLNLRARKVGAGTVRVTFSCKTTGQSVFEDVRVIVPRIEIVKIWSEQIPGAGEASNFLPGGAGTTGNESCYILMGTRGDDSAHAAARFVLTPDIPELRDKLLFRFGALPGESSPGELRSTARPRSSGFRWTVRSVGTLPTYFLPLGPGDALPVGQGTISGDVVSLRHDGPGRLQTFDFTLVAGGDENGNGILDRDELLDVEWFDPCGADSKWKIIDRGAFLGELAKAEAAQLAVVATRPLASDNLDAFLDDDAPSETLVTQEVLEGGARSPLSHNVGVRWNDRGLAFLRVIQWPAGTDAANAVLHSAGFNGELELFLTSKSLEVERFFENNPNTAIHEFSWDFSFTSAFNPERDADLFFALGTSTISGTVNVNVLGPDGLVLDLSINASLSDLYDWNYEKPAEVAGFLELRFARIQAGFPNRGEAGHVYRVKIDLVQSRDTFVIRAPDGPGKGFRFQ